MTVHVGVYKPQCGCDLVRTTQSRPCSLSFTWAQVASDEVFGLQDLKPNLKSTGGHKGHSDNILKNVAPAMYGISNIMKKTVN